jgi:hypothetical protein
MATSGAVGEAAWRKACGTMRENTEAWRFRRAGAGHAGSKSAVTRRITAE